MIRTPIQGLGAKLSYGKKLRRLQEEHAKEQAIDKEIIDHRIG